MEIHDGTNEVRATPDLDLATEISAFSDIRQLITDQSTQDFPATSSSFSPFMDEAMKRS